MAKVSLGGTLGPPVIGDVRLVLLQPRNPENLGAIARAMKNFELSMWTLVDPRTHDFAAARRVAIHSEEILDRPALVETLAAAVANAAWVVGTSSRQIAGVPALEARAFAAQAAQRIAAGQEVALVFGDERSGMSNDDLSRCHALARIPTGHAQPSINLAQALTIFAYELRLATRSQREASARPLAAEVAPGTPAALAPLAVDTTPTPTGKVAASGSAATDAQLAKLETLLGQSLTAGGFLSATAPRHALRDLMRALQRAQLSPREWRLWMAAAGKLSRPR